MLQALAKKVVNVAVENGYIKEEQTEEYLYGLNLLINIVINDITLLAIGLLFRMFWECIIFLTAYKLLRKYCGGFHFSTAVRCYISSCIMCPIVLMCIRYIPFSTLLWSLPTLCMSALLLVISPVAAANKPLDKEEKTVFGRMARIIVICLSVLYIVMTMLNILTVSKAIAMSIVCVTVFAVAGKVHLGYLHKKA